MECYYCESELPQEWRVPLDGPWGIPTGDFVCVPCAERAFDDYMEARIG